jgi:predicted dehydrogenase
LKSERSGNRQQPQGDLRMEKVKIGFVGVGSMGQCAHLKNYATLPDCEVVAISDPRTELRRRVAQRYNIPHVYEYGEEMLAHEKLDGAVAPQPFSRHGGIVAPLYRFGIPILTEKPFASSVAAGEKMLAELEKGGSWHMVGYHKRSDPATMYAVKEIERLKATRELGPLQYVRVVMPAGDWVANGFLDLITTADPYPAFPDDPADPDMDADTYREYISFVNYYIHQVNLLRYLLGEPYRVTYADPSGVLLAIQSKSGVAGVLEMSAYKTTVDWQESALVAFEHGTVTLELPAPLASNRPGRVTILRDPGGDTVPQTITPQMPWIHAMRQQASNFVSAIRGDSKPPCEAAEALEDLKMARDYIRLWRA